MAHEKVYVICENLCLEEGMTKEQIEEKLNGVNNYSTEEVRVGTWINDKPYYKKTYVTDIMDSTSGVSNSMDISDLHIDEMVRPLEVVAMRNTTSSSGVSSKWESDSSNYNSADSYYNVFIDCQGELRFDKRGTRRYPKTYVTIYYTKTTDTANV